MSNDPRNHDRQNALLTNGQRKFLKGDGSGYSNPTKSEYRNLIPERIRQGLADFTLTLEELPPESREEVFDVEPRSEGQLELQRDLSSILSFIYLGVDGQPQFGRILEKAVQNAEVRRGGVENGMLVDVTFDVEVPVHRPVDEILDQVERGDLEALERAELYALVSQASRSEAIDFDTLRADWEERVRLADEHPQAFTEKSADADDE